jgi:hypothetical protein
MLKFMRFVKELLPCFVVRLYFFIKKLLKKSRYFFEYSLKILKISKLKAIWFYFHYIFLFIFLQIEVREYYSYGFSTFAKSRKSFYLASAANKKINFFNNRYIKQIIDNKVYFNTYFKDFINRKWLYLGAASHSQIDDFFKEHPICILKPIYGAQGKGIKVIDKNYLENMNKNLFNNYIIEEKCQNHILLDKINSYSLNTIRINSFYKENTIILFEPGIRFSTNQLPLDNLSSGGIYAKVNIDSGTIVTEAYDLYGNKYDDHPNSGETIKGVALPYWPDIMELVKKAALMIPDVKIIGWDVAITSKGLMIIEANSAPMFSYKGKKDYYNELFRTK